MKLNICMLLSDLYDPNHLSMTIRPAIREIYGNCFPSMGHKVTYVMPAKIKIKEVQEQRFQRVRILLIPYHQSSFLATRILAKLISIWKERKVMNRLVREERVDLIQARSSILDGLLTAYLKCSLKVPFVFQYSFPSIEGYLEKYKPKYGLLSSFMAKLRHRVLSLVISRADLILAISGEMVEKLADNGIPGEDGASYLRGQLPVILTFC